MRNSGDCHMPKLKPTEVEKPEVEALAKYYYDGTSWIMRFMANSVPDKSIQRIGKVLEDPRKTKSALIFGILENPFVFLIFIAWLFLGGFLIFLVFLHFACRLLYERKGKKVTSQSMAIAAFSFIGCVITAVCGMILFQSSLGSVQNGLELLPKQLNVTASDITTFAWHLNESVHCLNEDFDVALTSDLEKIWNEIQHGVDQFKKDFGTEKVLRAITVAKESQRTMENLKNLTLGISDKQKQNLGLNYLEAMDGKLAHLIASFTELSDTVNYTHNRVEKGFRILENEKSMTLKKYGNISSTLKDVVAFVKISTINTQTEIVNVFTEREYSRKVSSFLGYTLFFPLCLTLLSILGLAGILGSWKFYMGGDRDDAHRYRRGAVADAIGNIISSAAYSAMIIGSMLCFMTAMCFLLAFTTMLICTGMFRDNDLRLLQAVPKLHHTAVFGDQVVHYSLHDIFYKCKNGYAFFDAINGSHIMAETEVNKRFSNNRRYDVAREIRNFHVDHTIKNQIIGDNNDVKRLLGLHINYANQGALNSESEAVKDAILSLRKQLGELTQGVDEFFSSTGNLDILSSTLKRKQQELKQRFLRAFSLLFKAVVDISPQCESLMEIWNTLGDYVCYCISFPTQGLWVACMICAIGSSAIYHAFFNTSRFLHDYAATTKEILDRRRKREQKFEYVRRQMDNFGRAPDSPPSISEKGSNDVPYTRAIPKEPVDRGEEESTSQGTSKEANATIKNL
ncbi:hypothetical protein Q1695_015578 [Nippostrongylus brasiliensis]|nr:hypothetical protein Q1695_015578 [Nippostrongylus brasiliensis]